MVGRSQLNKLIKKEKSRNASALLGATSSENSVVNEIGSHSCIEETQNNNIDDNIVCELNAMEFREELKEWYLKYRPSIECTTSLLKILKKKHSEIPLSVSTLIGQQQLVLKRTVAPGTYFHIGIETNLKKIIDYLKNENVYNIVLDVGIDGLPLFKSKDMRLWPILGRIINLPNVNIFLIGSYVGTKKPVDVDLYLHDLVFEIKKLKESGFFVDSHRLEITIRAFIVDIPARSFVCGIRGYNALNGCSKCYQKGLNISNVTTFSKSVSKLRTDEDFKNRIDQDFHQSKFVNMPMALETLGIKMITQFPIDVMHLVDLGVMKRMILKLLTSKTNECLSRVKKQEMSSLLTSLYPFVPREFSRKPSS